MDPVKRLPDADLRRGGALAQRFRGLGLHRFRQACRWLRDLPYGWNQSIDDPGVALDDGFGTCYSKHAAAVVLATELGLTLERVAGFYRLDASIVPSAAPILAEAGLPWLPQVHCFLVAGSGARVDLTEGNCHGKTCLPERYELEIAVPATLGYAGEDRLYRAGLELLQPLHGHLAEQRIDVMLALRDRCSAATKAGCAMPAAKAYRRQPSRIA